MKRSRFPNRLRLVRQPYEGDWIVQGWYRRFRFIRDPYDVDLGVWVGEWVDLGGGETRRAALRRSLRAAR